MTVDVPARLGPLGRRLLAAFVVVALSSVIVLTVAALVGTSRGLNAGESERRQATATAAAASAGDAYRVSGGWAGVDLSGASDIASAAGAGLLVFDVDGSAVSWRGGRNHGSEMPGNVGQASERGAATAPIALDGTVVGSVRLGFGSPAATAARSIAWSWIIVAAVIALVVAFAVALYVSSRIARPLARLASVARSFAAGDRAVRASPADVAAPGELGELARAFDATATEVARSERVRRAMAADIAHELRTPLAALQAGLEELRDGLVEPDPVRLEALHAQSLRLGRVVSDLAELSAAESAALTLHHSLLDLGALVTDAVMAAGPALDTAGVLRATSIADNVWVVGDADRLHQAVGNLLTNVARHCRAGDSVTVTVRGSADWAEVCVEDTGPGIAAVDLPRVFERLWRGSADTSGSGIGLAVVRELVEAHGGTVTVTSDGSSGCTFTIRVPRASGT